MAEFVLDSLKRDETRKMPDEIKEFLLIPIIHQMQAELQDVRSHRCDRVSVFDRVTLGEGTDEIDEYGLRLHPEGKPEPSDFRSILRLVRKDAACAVGLSHSQNRISNKRTNTLPDFCGTG